MKNTEYNISLSSDKGISFSGKGNILEFQQKALLVAECLIKINALPTYYLPVIKNNDNGVGRITITHNDIDENHQTTFDLFNGIVSDIKSSPDGEEVVNNEIQMKDLNSGKRFINGKLMVILEKRSYSYRWYILSNHLFSGISVDLRTLLSSTNYDDIYTSLKPSFYVDGNSVEPVSTLIAQTENSYQLKIQTLEEERIILTATDISADTTGIMSHPYYIFLDPDEEQNPPPSLNLFQQVLLGNTSYTENTETINDLKTKNFITKASSLLFFIIRKAAFFFIERGCYKQQDTFFESLLCTSLYAFKVQICPIPYQPQLKDLYLVLDFDCGSASNVYSLLDKYDYTTTEMPELGITSNGRKVLFIPETSIFYLRLSSPLISSDYGYTIFFLVSKTQWLSGDWVGVFYLNEDTTLDYASGPRLLLSDNNLIIDEINVRVNMCFHGDDIHMFSSDLDFQETTENELIAFGIRVKSPYAEFIYGENKRLTTNDGGLSNVRPLNVLGFGAQMVPRQHRVGVSACQVYSRYLDDCSFRTKLDEFKRKTN